MPIALVYIRNSSALAVEHANAFNLLIGWGGYGRAPPDLMVEHLKVLISRAPKGDGGLISRACLRIL